MFLNISQFKKLAKKAYNGVGLTIANTNYYIVTNFEWGVVVEKEFATNKFKAALVELIGDFPEDGEVACYSKNQTQMMLEDSPDYILEQAKSSFKQVLVSPLIYQDFTTHYRLLQTEYNDSKRITALNTIYESLVSAKEIDILIEDRPVGPVRGDNSSYIFWKNDYGFIFAAETTLSEEVVSNVFNPINEVVKFGKENIE